MGMYKTFCKNVKEHRTNLETYLCNTRRFMKLFFAKRQTTTAVFTFPPKLSY